MTQKATMTILIIIICILSCATIYSQSSTTHPLPPASKFNYLYKDMIFNCKVTHGNNVVIHRWRPKGVKDVTIPAIVTDESDCTYRVESVDLSLSGYYTDRIVIEEGVSRIEKDCFYLFHDLKRIVIPSSIKYIGKRAFGKIKFDSKYDELLAENSNRNLIIEALKRADKDGGAYLTFPSNGTDSNATPIASLNPVSKAPPVATTTVQNGSTPVIKVKSFIKAENSIEAIRGKKFDYNNKPCALLKITIARYKPLYSSSDIPEPLLNHIDYNVKGKDHIWMANGAVSLDVYSNNKEFEPITLFFKNISKGKIPQLESGCVYELRLRVEYEK